MPSVKQRVIIISPQHWGTMRVTKHHYAMELANLGHEVYFLEPIQASWKWSHSKFEVVNSDAPGVKLIKQQINVPFNLKFHAKWLYDWFIERHVKKLEKHFGALDIVWSFDLTDSMPLRFFSKKAKKLFFAADWPRDIDAVKASDSCHVLVSVAQEILDQYPNNPTTKKLLIDHGVADLFSNAGKEPFVKTDSQIRMGMSGNFLRPDIDRPVLLDIIQTHTDVLFECFGAFETNNSNLGGATDDQTRLFIEALKMAPNVVLHGTVSTEVLAKELRRMDAFLICYDVEKDQSKGTNYHKVTEYMAYNRLILSNYFSHKNASKIHAVAKNQNWLLTKSMDKILDNSLELHVNYSGLLSYRSLTELILHEVA